ncbi:MAG: glutamate mutase L, partial [Candidatus Promineifilaceae bacterium]
VVDYEEIDELIGIVTSIHRKRHILKLPGLDGIRDPSKLPILPTAHAFGGITEYLAALFDGKVVGLDIGSSSVSLSICEPGKIDLFIRTDLGLGAPIANVLNKNGMPDIYSWTPKQTRSTDVRDFILNKSIMAQSLPQESKELVIEQAVAGQLAKGIAAEMEGSEHLSTSGKLSGSKLLVLRGGVLSKSPSFGYPLLAVLDGLQPVGVFRVVVDKEDILPAMGLLAAHHPQLVVQVLDNDFLIDVGWVVAADGDGELGQPVVKLTVELDSGKLIKRDVKYGGMEVIKIPPGQNADLALQPAAGIDIGKGPGNPSFHKITSGVLGLLVDARGELRRVQGDEVLRRKHQQRWMRVMAS